MAERIQGYRFGIDMDDGGMARTMKELRNEAQMLKGDMRANFAEIRSGEGIMSAYANKVKDAERAIDAQKAVIQKAKSEQNGLDLETEKGREAYQKYERQINTARNAISSLEGQQNRAKQATDSYATEITKLKDNVKLSTQVTDSYVNKLKDQGRNFEAQKIKLNGLRTSHSKMGEQLKLEQTHLTELGQKYGSQSSEYQKQIIKVNELTTKYQSNEREIKSLNRSIGGMSVGMLKFRDTAEIASSKVKAGFEKIRVGAVAASAGIGIAGAAALSGAKKASSLQNAYKVTTNLLVTGGEKQAEVTKNIAQMQRDGEKYSIRYGKSQHSIAEGYQELVKRGYTSKEALGAMRSELEASIASGDDFSDVLTVTSQVVDAYGLRTDNAAKMTKNTRMAVNELAYSADMTATGFQSLGKGMEYVGDSAHSAGIPLSTTAAALGELSNHGLEADKAGTGLRKVLNQLTTDVKNIDKKNSVLKKLGIQKSDILDANGNLKDLSSIMAVINDKTKDMGTGEKNAIFNSLFGTTGQQAGIILAQNNKELKELADNTEKAGQKGNYVHELAEKNSQTAQMSEAKFKQAWNDLTIMFGAKLLPYMTEAADGLSKLFAEKGFRKDVEKTADGVGHVANGIIDLAKGAVQHKDDVLLFGKVVAGLWVIDKVRKFTRATEDFFDLIGVGKSKIIKETEQVNLQTAAYQKLANAKSEASLAGTGSVGMTTSKVPVNQTTTYMPNGKAIAETAEKTLEKSGSKWNILGQSLGSRLINGAGLAITAWDAGSSIAKAVHSGKSSDAIRAGSKTAGTLIGGTLGAVIAGPGGAMIGASIGDQIGGSKTVNSAVKKFVKSWNKAMGKEKLKAPRMSTTSAKKQLNDVYKLQEKQALNDLKTLRKAGTLSEKEYQKQVASTKKYYEDKAKAAKKGGTDENTVNRYYAKQRQDIDTKYNNARKKATSKIDTELAQMQAQGETNTYKYKKLQKERREKLDKLESKHKKQISDLNIKYAQNDMTGEAKAHMTLSGKIQTQSKKQEKILAKLKDKKANLSQISVFKMISDANKEYKETTKLADKQYDKIAKTADKQRAKVAAAADRQYKSVKAAADNQYKKTVDAANRQYKGHGAAAEKQRKTVIAKAEDQRKKSVEKAESQRKNSVDKAEKQRQETVNKAEKQRQSVTDKAEKQRDDVKEAARNQGYAVSKHAVDQANNSMDASKKQAGGTQSIWNKLAKWWGKFLKWVGVDAPSTHKTDYGYTPATMHGGFATGGQITRNGMAFVGEAGPELRYEPYSGHVDIVGQKGPQFVPVKANEQILNASDTRKVFSGQYQGSLPGYATGNISFGSFISNIKNTASNIWDNVSDKAADFFDKITDPAKAMTDVANKAFNLDSVKGAGTGAVKYSKGLVKKTIDGMVKKFNELKDMIADSAGGGSFDGKITNGWGVYDYLYNIAKKVMKHFGNMHVSSGYRPGDRYFHGKHQAIDIALPASMNGSGKYRDIGNYAFDHFKKQIGYVITLNRVRDRSGNSGTGIHNAWTNWAEGGHMDHLHLNGMWGAKDIGSGGGGKVSGNHASLLRRAGFRPSEIAAADWVVNVESSWNPNAVNPTSGAFGLAQSLGHGMAGHGTPLQQLKWMAGYIHGRYGNANKAKSFHKSHNWYANGGIVDHEQFAHIAEGNLPESIVPWDLAKRSQAYRIMQTTMNHFAKTDKSNGSSIEMVQENKDLKQVNSNLSKVIELLTNLLGVGGATVNAIKAVGDPTKRYKQDALNQIMTNYQAH